MVDLDEESLGNAEAQLTTPQTAEEFSFPVEPYGIQLEFMQRLFETLERGEFGVFESPTGTGKSLSIICGALTWLKHNSQRNNSSVVAEKSVKDDDRKDDVPDWVKEFEKKQAASRVERKEDGELEKYCKWVAATRRKEAAAQNRGQRRIVLFSRDDVSTTNTQQRCKRSVETANQDQTEDQAESDDEAIVEAYYSDNAAKNPDGTGANDGFQYSASVRKLLERRAANRMSYTSDSDSNNSDGVADSGPPLEPNVCKIYYASRTHSQLQQFVNEIKRTAFGKAADAGNKIKCVTLGSRLQLCTNDKVRSTCSSVHTLNERCLEMQQSSKKQRCAHLPTLMTPMFGFKDHITERIMDIEELATEGRRLSVCAYYGARESIRGAHVVALPYNMLLSQSSRESMGISLANSVVIVDEAHNLVDTILATHSVTLDWQTVRELLEIVQLYFKKYWRRLNGSNTVYIRQTIALLRAFNKYMQGVASGLSKRSSKDLQTTTVLSVNDFLQKAHADHINVYKIDRYLRQSKIGRKLNMFADRRQLDQLSKEEIANTNAGQPQKRQRQPGKRIIRDAITTQDNDKYERSAFSFTAPASAVAALESFMECIGNPDRTGARLVVRAIPPTADSNEASEVASVELKYLLLDPSEAFGEIRKEARAVVLAGGTMQPTNDMIEQLLPQFGGRILRDNCTATELQKLEPKQVRQFAWNHVVSSSHICATVVSSGPTGTPLRFAFQDQSDILRIKEAGQALAALCNVIPGGVVVFFPSHALLGKMAGVWKEAGIISRIAKRKPVFAAESAASDVLSRYSEEVKKSGGAVLLSVVGGRLSEGINFSDHLGRAVVMIGVPFPSLASPELNERLSYYESLGSPSEPLNTVKQQQKQQQMGLRARDLYESLCMRAVNQSIGRAIRHRSDYAAIVFLDVRYAEKRLASKLPAWITSGNKNTNASKNDVVADAGIKSFAFGPALAQIASFFKRDFGH
ncbi:DNA repair helicase [Coemansia reversa NRRL 1564]|uniref:ATP-dependent DNA helicase CHL1 n=1 Tax=Coemansia reversa (strain ATCC 12441 / NRRL 1564) TaxID=763665 RepID=A0A2G5B2Z4_COERN|nr:DNA repair helicase [Coemansia reversa NRRL 1564]|eukprot:PIA13365.1 DNA repair helicase [Coemansia reversa NRRL 1564]